MDIVDTNVKLHHDSIILIDIEGDKYGSNLQVQIYHSKVSCDAL